ncbi:MAG: hypothetical protein QF664_12805, partial [Dehalococcoidia bacterium]|nr:hypothetical protein [Dehalococcoidia bacterium]
MATYTMAWDVGAVLGGVLLGVVIDATSYSTGFVICAAMPVAAIAFYIARVHEAGASAGDRGSGDTSEAVEPAEAESAT